MPAKYPVKQLKDWGDKFLQYLIETQREDINDKEELREIYNEFKTRDSVRKPSFSGALYGLRKSGKAVVHRDNVTLNQVVRKKVPLSDQYQVIRREKRLGSMSLPPCSNDLNCTRGQARRIIRWMKQNKSKFIGQGSEIHVTSDYDLTDGKIRFRLLPNEQKSFSIRIRNDSTAPVTFIQYKLLRKMRVFSFQDDRNVSQAKSLPLNPGDVYEITVHCTTTYYGYFPVIVVFEFRRGNDESSSFLIGRFLSAVCNSKLSEELGPTSPYVPYQKSLSRQIIRNEDEGVPPDNALTYHLEREIKLGDFTPSDRLRFDIKADMFTKSGQRAKSSARSADRDLLFSNLDFANYDKRFSLMLHLEEIQMEIDIRRYDKKEQPMIRDAKNKKLLVLDVPGVAENRPSVLRGDHLFVVVSAEAHLDSEVINYKGYVHAVELEKVKLGFSQRLLQRFIDGMTFDVIFTFNRLPLKVQHRAVQMAKEKAIDQFLFPTKSDGLKIQNTERLVFYDRSLEKNEEQLNAVKHIVSGISRPAPYLVFGPPGTGKTVTLVEAIKQVLKCIPGAHVLTCAPSNSACDLLCQRLMKHIDLGQIYRMMASSRNYRDVPEDIKPCCNWSASSNGYVYPRKTDLMNYKVIITTLVTAGRLVSANFPKGHFSHVFIDESGHAVEPECVTAIAGILDVMQPTSNAAGGQLVLAGDPKQLGPILRSPLAIENGLGISLLERLMTQNSLYQKGSQGYNSQFVTKLLKNYRSHPSILKVPNELFYDCELQSCADDMQSTAYCNWEKLPRKGLPIIFHGVTGKDEREGNSPSFFNVNEVQEIVTYLLAILETQGKKGLARISPKEIGIISPYRKQVEKIRTAVTKCCKGVPDIKDLKVGSVEEFQGQERKVILISTVRSSEDYVKFDEDFNLGFLKNPKRFNVAITRAKALLILVGNPIILSRDPNWSTFLNYCRDNGAYTGINTEDFEVMQNGDELIDLFSNLNIDGPPAGEASGESFVQQQAEPGWRSEV